MCRCYIKGGMQSLCETLWMLRGEVSLSLHLVSSRKSRKILVRRSLTRSCSRSPSQNIFGSWMVETWLPGQPLISAKAKGIINPYDNVPINFTCLYASENSNASSDLTDEAKQLENSGSNFVVSKQLLGDLDFEDDFSSELYEPYSRCYQPVEEPWLLEASIFSQYDRQIDSSNDLCENNISEREYPVEEPWLSIKAPTIDVSLENKVENIKPKDQSPRIEKIFDKLTRVSVGNEKESEKPVNELEEIPKRLFLDNEGRVGMQGTQQGVSVDTVILINSSLCTMQRVAVMEDEKLVEILLEPIKNNVHCDSVYIGVVTKLVPNMGGAFVNIGHPRASLVGISHHVEPFIFPPFSRHKEPRSVDGSLLVELLEHSRVNENNKPKSEEQEVIDNIEENDDDMDDDEFDVPEDFPEDVNGGVVNSVVYINGKRNIFQPIETSHDSNHQTMTEITDSNKGPCTNESKWAQVQKGTKIIVQVVKEGLGTKGPTLTAYPKLRSRFWVCGYVIPILVVTFDVNL